MAMRDRRDKHTHFLVAATASLLTTGPVLAQVPQTPVGPAPVIAPVVVPVGAPVIAPAPLVAPVPLAPAPIVSLAPAQTPSPPAAAAPPAAALTPTVELGKLATAVAGTRLTTRVQNPRTPDKINDVGMEGELQILLAGQIHPLFKWQAGIAGTFGGLDSTGAYNSTGRANLLELIGKLDLSDAFHFWMGRMLVPVDRATLSTTWSLAAWTLPGDYVRGQPRLGPRQAEFGRSDGAVAWGQWRGGTLKYYLGALGLADPLASPAYSARLSLSLLNPEPGYRIASSYYGDKDVFALGVGAQVQPNGSVSRAALPAAPDDYAQLNVDLLLEKNVAGLGVVDLEGAFYKVWGNNEPAQYHWFALFSCLLPIEVGLGRFQPLVRFQHAKLKQTDGKAIVFDSQLGYVIDDSRLRVAVLYQYSRTDGVTGNAILAGLQLVTP
jgi:hypothetical protein